MIKACLAGNVVIAEPKHAFGMRERLIAGGDDGAEACGAVRDRTSGSRTTAVADGTSRRPRRLLHRGLLEGMARRVDRGGAAPHSHLGSGSSSDFVDPGCQRPSRGRRLGATAGTVPDPSARDLRGEGSAARGGRSRPPGVGTIARRLGCSLPVARGSGVAAQYFRDGSPDGWPDHAGALSLVAPSSWPQRPPPPQAPDEAPSADGDTASFPQPLDRPGRG
jgi:hypothetical protein